jgi:two-component system response regulator DesR
VDDHNGQRRVSVVVVGDEELIHWGLRALLATQSWSGDYFAAPSVEAAVSIVERSAPAVAVIDLDMLGSEPWTVCHELALACPRLQILLLATAEAMSPAMVRSYGAVGSVSRRARAQELLNAVRAASAAHQTAIMSAVEAVESGLSARQQEILDLIATGATNSEIAGRLFLSHNTVKQHTSALYRKLGVKNRAHAVQAARQQGLLAI